MSNDLFGYCAEPECNDTSVPPELPSFGEMTKNLLSTVKDVAGGLIVG